MKKIYILSLAMSLSMAMSAQTYNAPLEMTAGAGWGAASGEKPTINGDYAYYNNDNSSTGSKAWNGCAYAEFDLSGLPSGVTVTKATLTYSTVQNNNKPRTDQIYYMLPTFVFDEANFLIENQDKRYVSERSKNPLATVNTKAGENIGLTADVTEGVKALVEADAKNIFFQITGNAGSAQMYGKPSSNPPTLVIEYVDAATTTSYTVNFLYNGSALQDPKTYDGGAIGSSVKAPDSDLGAIYKDDVKYIYVDGNNEITLVDDASSNVINLNFRVAGPVSYSLTAISKDNPDMGIVNRGEGLEKDTISVGYPEYLLHNGVFYQANATNKEFAIHFILGESESNQTVTYNPTNIENVMLYVEGEEIPGATKSDYPNATARTSKAGCGWSKDTDLVLGALTPGTYKLTAGFFYPKKEGNSHTFEFTAGANNIPLTVKGSGNGTNNAIVATSNEFVVDNDTDLVWKPSGYRDMCLDYAYVQKTSDNTQTAITNIENDQNGELIIYNMLGQRVKNPEKGIYIINGKKVLVK